MCKLPVPTFSFFKQNLLARPPNRHFRGQTPTFTPTCPPNRHFRGQTQPKPMPVHQNGLLVDGLQMLVLVYSS